MQSKTGKYESYDTVNIQPLIAINQYYTGTGMNTAAYPLSPPPLFHDYFAWESK